MGRKESNQIKQTNLKEIMEMPTHFIHNQTPENLSQVAAQRLARLLKFSMLQVYIFPSEL